MTHETNPINGSEQISKILTDVYTPFANIKRDIIWLTDETRYENDAEHSFSLALICGEMADQLEGLSTDRVVTKAIIHDLVEVYADDTSVWDEEGLKDKATREHEAFEELKQEYGHNSWMIRNIEEYEGRQTEEDKFVYAMDKLLAVLIIVNNDGKFWKENGVDYSRYLEKYNEKRRQVAEHQAVLKWYDEVHWHVSYNREFYFK